MGIAAVLLQDPAAPRKNRARALGSRTTLGGERVALLAEPGAPFVEAFFGVLRRGAAPSSSRPAPGARDGVLLRRRAACGRSRVAGADAGTRRRRGRAARAPSRGAPRTSARARCRRSAPGAATSDPALQLYTSGTTGKPKGAVITHENLAMQQELLGEAWAWRAERRAPPRAAAASPARPGDRACSAPSGAGARCGSCRSTRARRGTRWRPPRSSWACPTIYAKLFAALDARRRRDPRALDRGRPRASASRRAAARRSRHPRRAVARALRAQYPLERFGMTEIGVGMTNPLPGARRPGTVGSPLRTVETRIVGEDGREATEGELWMRGPSVFSGYHERPDATQQAFANDERGGPPWFRTGDTVTKDARRLVPDPRVARASIS